MYFIYFIDILIWFELNTDLTLRKNSWFLFCFKYVNIDQAEKERNIFYDHHYCWIQMYTGETDLIHETEIKELYLVILFELLYRATQVYTMLSIIKIDK